MKYLTVPIVLLALYGCSSESVSICASSTDCEENGSNSGDTGGDGGSDGDTGGQNGGQNTLTVSGLSATHRNGQTFLTWDEPNDSANYHVYRSTQPITNVNLSSATLLTGKWGPLDSDTSINKHAIDAVPGYFVVNDLGAPLSFNTGLFVHTTQNGQNGNAWYAVTTVLNGNENKSITTGANTLASAVNETTSTARPVLTLSQNGGKGRIYTQYMDYANWNPTFNGYAFNYIVALPSNYNSSRSYPLQLQLHAYEDPPSFIAQSEFDWQVIQVLAIDPGESQNTTHTWWYGHAADHNYNNSGAIPTGGRIENYTEQRVISAIEEVISNTEFNVNRELIHAFGNSMGASGAVSLAMRYPSVFAGIYASQPMTNYASSPTFQSELVKLWGQQSSNLQIINRGPNSAAITKYSANGSQPTSVWDWMNHHQQLRRRRADDFSFMMMDFGKADTTIDWATQGQPMFQALTDAKTGFTATALGGIGHNWMGFNAINANQFGLENGSPWSYPKSLSFVSLQFASGSGSLQPGSAGNDEYNTSIEWSTAHNSFHQNIVDTANRYEISLRSLTSNQTASVTPRNTRSFKPATGRSCSWTATNNSNNSQIATGTTNVDGNALVTATAVPVVTGNGTRLVINCQ